MILLKPALGHTRGAGNTIVPRSGRVCVFACSPPAGSKPEDNVLHKIDFTRRGLTLPGVRATNQSLQEQSNVSQLSKVSRHLENPPVYGEPLSEKYRK